MMMRMLTTVKWISDSGQGLPMVVRLQRVPAAASKRTPTAQTSKPHREAVPPLLRSGSGQTLAEKPPVYQVSSETASIVIHARENLSSLTSVDEHSGISNKDEQHYMKDLAGDGFNPDGNIKEGSICVLNEVRDVEENSTRQRKISTASWTASEPTNPREFQYEALSEDEDDEEAELLRRRVAELNAALALEPPIERSRPPQASRVAFKESLVDFEVSFPPDELQSEAEEASSQALHCLPVPVSVSTAEQMQLEEQSMEKGAMKFAKVQSVCSSEAPSLGPPEIITRTPPASLESSYRKKPSMKNGRGEAVSEMGNTKDAATSASISVSISKKDVGRTRRISHSGDVGRHAERPVPVSPKVRPNSSSLSLQKAKTPRSSAKTSIGKRKEQEEELEKARLMTEERRRMNEKVMQEWLLQKEREETERKYRQKAIDRYNAEQQQIKAAEEEKRRQESFQTWLHQKEMQRNWERLLKEREEEEKRQAQENRSREASEQAFKEWLRRKNREAQQRARESKERRRIGQAILLQRQRSGAVIRALQRANAGNLFFDVDPDF
uniref:Coiled-coil domain-containing protein 181 n=1 Tax=Schistocephalus solidus TaxID=70667 RepID=A0A0X3NGM8_SCHSO